MSKYPELDTLSKEELIAIIEDEAKNWLAHDGLWFQAVERHFGLNEAIKLDIEAWRDFTVIEAKRIMERLKLPKNSGLEGLRKSSQPLECIEGSTNRMIEKTDNSLILKMVTCRVQSARQRKISFFPCKSVGIVEYSYFASTIDERIKTYPVKCPPDDITDAGFHCAWEFKLEA